MATYDELMQMARRAHEANQPDHARRLVQMAQASQQPAEPQTNVVEQGMSGVNEGIAATLGAPVDLTTGAFNLASRGINAATGVDLGQIENPALGSEQIRNMMAPTISDVEPQTGVQRVTRRVGQEAGGGIIPAMGIAGAATRGGSALARGVNEMGQAARGNLGRYSAGEAGGMLGSGLGASAAQELAPDSALAEITGQLLGGGIGARAASPSVQPDIPTLDDLRARQGAAYQRVEDSQATITPQSRDQLVAALRQRMVQSHMHPDLHRPAAVTLGRLEELPSSPTIYDVEQGRQLVGRDVAGATEAGTRRLGVEMKSEIDDYLAQLDDTQMQGGDADSAVAALREGRETTQRIARASTVDEALQRGERRAATSGTGGNEVNAIRQNIRTILDNPKRRRQFNEDQLQAMDDIVRGTPSVNAARLLGRMAPTSGALPMLANMASVGASASQGNLLGLIPAALGEGAKRYAERSTQGQVDGLTNMILANTSSAPQPTRPIDQAIISALVARAASAQAERN